MEHLTLDQARLEATIYNALLAKGFINPENQQSLNEAIDSVFEV